MKGSSAASVVRHHGRVLLRTLEELGVETWTWTSLCKRNQQLQYHGAWLRGIHALYPSSVTTKSVGLVRTDNGRTLPRSTMQLGMTQMSQIMVDRCRQVRKYA